MTKRKTHLSDSLLRRAARLAEEKMHVQGLLSAAFDERYGAVYSSIDVDQIIDILDYHGGDIDLEECDRIMTEHGYPPRGKAK